MIKKTLAFSNPVYLSLRNGQMVIKFPEKEEDRTIPIEDIGVVVLEHKQITITHALISAMLDNNCALVIQNPGDIRSLNPVISVHLVG